MIDLWIALGVIALALLALGGVGLTRRRGRARPTGARPPGARPPGAPSGPSRPAAPPAPSDRAPAAPPPEVEAAPPPAAPEQAPATVAEAPAEPFRAALGRSRGLFAGLRSLRERSVEPAVWDDLEATLLRADVGVATVDALLEDLRRRVKSREIADGAQLLDALRGDLLDLLVDGGGAVPGAPPMSSNGATVRAGATAPADGSAPADREGPGEPDRTLRFDDDPDVVNVWLFVGVNGVGKTTTVGKMARQQAAAGRSVLLAAGDTFRAAAGEQLDRWADRVGAEIVRGAEGGDPSAIVFDAVQRAAARGNRLVLADTAGRLHTKVNLVEELKKIRRVADRPPGRVTEVLLVLDATTGQNGLVQARQFTDAVAVTGVVLTKLDGTAKGGIVVAIQRELGLPVKLVGLGEGPDDLVPFDPAAFVGALLA